MADKTPAEEIADSMMNALGYTRADTKTADADREDALGVLHWLLTDCQSALHAVALAAAEGDAMRTAVVANAARAWRDACAHLADVCEAERGDHA